MSVVFDPMAEIQKLTIRVKKIEETVGVKNGDANLFSDTEILDFLDRFLSSKGHNPYFDVMFNTRTPIRNQIVALMPKKDSHG